MWQNIFFFNDTATTEIYPLSLHDALPISRESHRLTCLSGAWGGSFLDRDEPVGRDAAQDVTIKEGADRKSTRLNSSHGYISYAVFCLKKKKLPPPYMWP